MKWRWLALAALCQRLTIAQWTPFAHLEAVPEPDLTNSTRVSDLIRAGNMYLSLSDALALALENNFDVELQRYGRLAAQAELKRARGGGALRGLYYVVLESPAGVGGPLSPVVTSPATATRTASGSSVSTNNVALGALASSQSNLSIQGTVGQTNGTSIPVLDPSITGALNWNRQTALQTNIATNGTPELITRTATANAGIQQGFLSGAQISGGYNNAFVAVNSTRSSYSPYSLSTFGLNVTQPLMRGFGTRLNSRFIRMAVNEQRISSLLFHQQLVSTVYGIIRLYTDLQALYADRQVKQESVTASERLYADIKSHVETGTAAPIELVRANALIFTSRQDLINASGLLEEQEAILKNVLTRRGVRDAAVRGAKILPTDTLALPEADNVQPVEDLIGAALANRPDLGQARLQLANTETGLAGARNALLPQVDLVGVAQMNGLAGQTNPLATTADGTFLGGYPTALGQLFRAKYPTYSIGVQLNLPLHNRIAEADYARDQVQLRQQRVRLTQLENQACLEIEDALIAMRRARASYESAVQARVLQQQSLDTERLKYEAGASTSYFVIQYETQLAQARSTEVAAISAYRKARAALQRATGTILDDNGISLERAAQGRPR